MSATPFCGICGRMRGKILSRDARALGVHARCLGSRQPEAVSFRLAHGLPAHGMPSPQALQRWRRKRVEARREAR